MSELQHPLALSTDAGMATVYDQGAHVASWTPYGNDPVLFVSRRSGFTVGSPIRGGIPVCFPWFGPGRSGDRTPSHGFARIVEWSRVRTEDSTAVFELSDAALSPEHRESFPHAFRAQLQVTAGASLEVRLTVENTGEEAFEIEEALHTYLAVGDVREVVVHGLEDAQHLDKTRGHALTPAAGEPLRLTGETDRVYLSSGPVAVEDPVLGRRLRITTQGAANTVVWNPWTEKAAAMPDFGDEEWPAMLCIEGANALDDAVTVEPGSAHAMSYRIDVETD
ncbi:D-hexose-6-phosphate mutarotase [Kocuria palustris]|uniref:D-hexose-6-phosphate mutarotase n=1 Tax=Kocuria palustris TaxID=71999 RepID=UPI0011A4DE4B|nr:D-hexose-6-phosphate mutarotase [Kocuria palustris]